MDKSVASSSVPGFFATLRGALSDLPRTDPTYNELAEVSRYNKQVRRLKETIYCARLEVAKLIEQATDGRIRGSFTVDDLRHWRLTSTNLLAGTTIVYDSYMRALVLEAVDYVVELINGACRFTRNSEAAYRVQEAVERWARNHQILLSDSYHMPENPHENIEMPAFSKMVIDFGLVYKKRRLNFVLHEINDFYGNAALQDTSSIEHEDLDLIKIQIYKLIDGLSVYDNADFLSDHANGMCRKLFSAELGRMEIDRFVDVHDAGISSAVKRLGIEADLARRNDDADTVLSSSLMFNLEPGCRNAILTGYLGYFYWDIILRPVVSAMSLEAGPIEEILIDRISPDDVVSLTSPTATRMLIGGTFAGFGGFLSRATRENDYLWGRLHAVERLFDILASTVPTSTRDAIDFKVLKKAAFERVIEEEGERLTQIPDLLARVRDLISAL
jgi:patatin-related protein